MSQNGNSQAVGESRPSSAEVEQLKRLAASHNLTPEAYDHIVRILGRQPTATEVGIFGVMWSEHCCYGSSRIYLRQFPTRGPCIVVPAGQENAGVVDIGRGMAVAFKCESHNHPSAVEPHAGAATGVGGILRDIFTMGARPIALLDSLRFGPLTPPPAFGPKGRRFAFGKYAGGGARTRFLLEGVVKGIADYGNCVGIPTVGGEIMFDDAYRDNPLVNVMCLGIVPRRRIARARARGVGNPVLYVGSSTGRDGLGGASFASRELTDGSDADRPSVQIGDPFAEKCLLEATLEALATGDVVGIQDMGAAGLTCSTCEMPSRSGTGIEIDVAKVPLREAGMIPRPAGFRRPMVHCPPPAKRPAMAGRPVASQQGVGMTPYEVMLSESQERMLLVVRRGRLPRVKRVFARWGLNAVEIGRVTGDGRLRVKAGSEVVAEIPVRALTDEAPVYRRPTRRPRRLGFAQRPSWRGLRQPADYADALMRLLGSPTIADKACVYEQYDHMVQTNTVVPPGRADAAVLRIKETGQWLAATIDGNGRACALDPYEGGKLAVAEAARNLVCVGARPLAVTDCLNFGNPQDPEVMWQFKACVRGIADACRAFGTPVTGGNVSFYNESPRGAIDPTPVIGMIGLIEGQGSRVKGGKALHPSPFTLHPVTAGFKDEGDVVILLGETREELGGSEYLAVLHHHKAGKPPRVDLRQERALQQLMIEAAARGWLTSAHDCSNGGLAVTLAECCIMNEEHMIGVVIRPPSTVHRPPMRVDALLFGESAGRIVVSCGRSCVEPLLALAKRHRVSAAVIGKVGGTRLTIDPWLDLPVEEMDGAWRTGLSKAMTDGQSPSHPVTQSPSH